MVIDWSRPGGDNVQIKPPKVRAAQYIRMSTEHQKYSTGNQSDAIQRYADRRGYEIVRTCADKGKSGLNLGGRAALQLLLDDIENGRADYAVVLVYDVSRWGRFQDPDEAATYELRCRRAGVAVHYCAEQFENDGSIRFVNHQDRQARHGRRIQPRAFGEGVCRPGKSDPAWLTARRRCGF